MRVERSTVDQVQMRLDELKRQKELEASGATGPTAAEAYEQRIAVQLAEEHARKKAKKDAKSAKKHEAEVLETEGMDPEMMAAMGFGGFGGSNSGGRR
jgi:U4/U6.U5 tri-snRNP component SNU23